MADEIKTANELVVTDVQAQLWPYLKAQYGIKLAFWSVALVGWEITWLLMVILWPNLGSLSAFIFFGPVAAIIAWYISMKNKLEGIFFRQFAQANNFTYDAKGAVGNLDGALFKIGHNTGCRDLVSGKYQDLPLELFNYRYTVGQGKSQHTYNYTVFRLSYPTPLPAVFLQVKGHEFGATLFDKFVSGDPEKVHLEANLDSLYTLWATQGFEMEALQIFAENFTQKLAQEWKNFSLQFVGDHLYIYSYWVIGKKDELENLYSLAKYLTDQLEPRLLKMKGDIVAMESYQNN